MDKYSINFKLDSSFLNENYLPEIYLETYNRVDKQFNNRSTYSIDINNHNKLIEAKNQIDVYYNLKVWDKIKKYTNPFEMIYITNKKNRRNSVSTYEPLSRSYFKMIEIGHEFFYDILNKKEPITTVHLAEGPGGFVEGIVNIRNRNDDNIYGMTLVSDNKEVPGWRRSWYFLSKHPNINILTGYDGTGNLYNTNNQRFLEYRVGVNKAEIVTGDGGFDFSVDYNKQELLAQKLIYSQFITALSVQQKGGHFVCKFFDIFNIITTQIIYLMTCFYEEVIIFKPYTSRPANSEKYIICRHYKGIPNLYLYKLRHILDLWNIFEKGKYRTRIKSIVKFIPDSFIQQIKNINKIILEEQIKYINYTINIIKNPLKDKDYDNITKEQINNATLWCKKYNIPFRNINLHQIR